MPASATPSRRIAALVVAATLGLFGLLVLGLTLQLRQRLRGAVLQREAEAIYSVALLELRRADEKLAPGVLSDPMPLLFSAVLESSRLRGVMAIQLFDARGGLHGALPDIGASDVQPKWWSDDLKQPAARYHGNAALEGIFGAQLQTGAMPTRVPLLEAALPLQRHAAAAQTDGIARYWIDGRTVAVEFSRLDRALALQAGLAYLGTALLVGAGLAWFYRRLAAANRRLQAQAADLARANQELGFAIKTGAVGAISAHLIHGIKNPLAGLENFIADPNTSKEPGDDAWRTAVSTTKRLRTMIQEVVAVLRDEGEGNADYPVPAHEVLAGVVQRTREAAAAANVRIEIVGSGRQTLLARTASLASLVLVNLLNNAIEASPSGTHITVRLAGKDDMLDIFVDDCGRGIPPEIRATLFQPVRSSKANGSGIGLAISRQLARHAGGELELVRSDTSGSTFALRVPILTAQRFAG